MRNTKQEGLVEERDISKKRNLSKERRINKVVELYNSNKYITTKQIADEIKVTTATVNNYLREAREKGLIKERIQVSKIYEEVARLCKKGLTREQIANELEIERYMVNTYIKKALEYGLLTDNECPDARTPNIRLENEIIHLYEDEHLNIRQIADRLEVSTKIVNKALRKLLSKERMEETKNKRLNFYKVLEIYVNSNLGISIEDIAKMTGLNEKTVYRYIKEARESGLLKKLMTSDEKKRAEFFNSARVNQEQEKEEQEPKEQRPKEQEIKEQEPKEQKQKSTILERKTEMEEKKFYRLVQYGVEQMQAPKEQSSKRRTAYLQELVSATNDKYKAGRLTKKELEYVNRILENAIDHNLSDTNTNINIVQRIIDMNVQLGRYQKAIMLLNKLAGNFYYVDREKIESQKRTIKRRMDEENAYKMFLEGKSIEWVQDQITTTELRTVDFVRIWKAANFERQQQNEQNKNSSAQQNSTDKATVKNLDER